MHFLYHHGENSCCGHASSSCPHGGAPCGHTHAHPAEAVPTGTDRRRTVLQYMLEHNRSHDQELAKWIDAMDPTSATAFHEVQALYAAANQKFEEALRQLPPET